MTSYERGYRAGIEAAAKVVEPFGHVLGPAAGAIAATIRALAPAAPKAPERPPHDGEGGR